MTEPQYVLTLDIGTSSLRAMLFDSHARAIVGAESKIEYEMRTTPDGGVEADADEMLDYAERAMDQVLARAGDRAKRIAAVASDSLVSNLIGVDAEGQAVTPMYTYADTRNADQVATLRASFDEETAHQRVGTLFHTSYLPARFLWLARERPEAFRRSRFWMSLGEYSMLRWTGQRACSYSVASWTGLLNRRKLAWDAKLLAALPVRAEQLSPLCDHDVPVGTLRSEYSARWPALRNAAWFPTLGDGAMANIGSGCIDATRVALTIGTSSAIRVTRPLTGRERKGARLPRGLWAYRVTGDHELVGGGLSEGGNLFAWMRDAFRLDPAQIEHELAALEPDSHGLTVLPFVAGERAPNWNAEARGAIMGISLSTRPTEVLRAGLEAVAYRLGLVYDSLRGVAPEADAVIASGGALMRSPTWIRIIADTLGVPVIASAEAEATSRGTALLALKALRLIDSLGDLPAQVGITYRPDAERHAVYVRATERQKKLYNAVSTTVREK